MPTGDAAEFRILGPLEVAVGSGRLDLGGARQQVVLAMLLLSANDVVSVDRLEEAIYGEDLPPTARSQAQFSVSSLRRLLAAHGHAAAISRQAQGYTLRVESRRLDSARFEELVTAGRADRDAGHLNQAATSYRDALRLWRGPALEGIDSLLIRAAAARLDEQRIAVTEDRLALELDLGRHHELVAELTELAWRYPLRERLRGQLMLTLYRCGRTAEALAVYQQTRRMMIDELGLEPGTELRRLERDILARDPVLDPPAGPVTLTSARRRAPRLLPADIADFTARAEQVDRIHHRLAHHRLAHPRLAGTGEAGLAVPVVVITGQGGVGKTSLAVHAAHGVAGLFGDGQLFADLHAGAAHPVSPMQVLERFLRALGVPGPQIPDGLDERAEVYRDLLADRRMLVVLDDAADEGQVSPLLPGSSAAAVLITSRSRLAGLAGAARIEVDVLDASQSLDLLGRIAGPGRVQAEARAAAAVARQCAHLPLALRIAGARLAARPHRDIQQLADRLADQTRRLDELEHGELGVRASISLSYQGASEQARVLLRRLALLEAPVFSGWMTSALLDQPPADAEDVLDELVNAHLVEPSGGPGQYRFHELIGVFARERLVAEEPAAERMAALERALGALLYLAHQACHRYYGGSYLPLDTRPPRWPLPSTLAGQLARDPLAWCERERAGLISGVRQAAEAGLVELCWSLARTTETLFESRSYLDDWREVVDIALQATRDARHVRGQAAMRYSLGSLRQEQGRFEAARREFDAAAGLFRDAGDDQGFALVIRNIAFIDRITGRLGEAARRYEQALAIFRTTGDQVAVAYALQSLARVKLESRELGPAGELLAEALQLTQEVPCGRIEAQVLYATGEVYLEAGELADAASMFERALAKVLDDGDENGQAYVLRGLGIVLLRQGELGRARDALQRARELADAAGVPLAVARALLGLSELALASGDPAQAIVAAQQASAAFAQMGALLREAEALTLLEAAHRAHGDAAAADAASARAAALRAGPADLPTPGSSWRRRAEGRMLVAMTSGYLSHIAGSGDLVAELAALGPQMGANTGLWPGLTIYRFTAPVGPSWEEIQSLSLCVVAQGRKAVTVDGDKHVYDPFHYLVLASHLHFQAEILEASIGRPFLSFVLQIDPALVRQVSSDMLERRTTAFRSRQAEAQASPQACVSALDSDLLGVVLRFLRAVQTDTDRRVLAPLYLQELVYRVLQREQYARLLALAAAQAASNPVSAVLEYVRGHLSEPLTVADMADLVNLSPSAFAHLFRDVTGRSPYQFLKEMRLDRSRELLVDGDLTVARISKDVGYASVSHFISEFRGRFGVTPRAYYDAHALHRDLAGMGNSSAGSRYPQL